MQLDPDVCYRAVTARDTRFDGVIFVGVRSTGVYCRPVCPARTPRRENCRFFPNAASAEQSGYRPCLRCRPELAPGNALIDRVSRIASAFEARVRTGGLEHGDSLETIAADLGVSARQLRRAVRQELGAAPVAYVQTARLLLAKQLLTATSLPVTGVALASGFRSVRRFNVLLRERYSMSPSQLRRSATGAPRSDRIVLRLAYRPPLAWSALLAFLRVRAIPGVEHIDGSSYSRTVCIDGARGWLHINLAERNCARVELSEELVPAIPAILRRVRALLDLDARPDLVDRHLAADPMLQPMVHRTPGLRVPGAFDPFELAVRAILGQQVSVSAANTLAARLVAAFGTPFPCEHPALSRLMPEPAVLAAAAPKSLEALGIPAARAQAIGDLAGRVARGELRLTLGVGVERVMDALLTVRGIGAWTAEYIAMRALHWPDAFPKGDVALRRALGNRSAQWIARRVEAWRPWRAYGVLHLWNHVAHKSSTRTASVEEASWSAVPVAS